MGKKALMFLFLFTMLFNGGLVPNYILIRNLKFPDTIWALVLPGAISAYNMIVTRTFFMTAIPEDLHESAVLDGCNEFRYLWCIVLPLSKAILAVLVLWIVMSLLVRLTAQRAAPIEEAAPAVEADHTALKRRAAIAAVAVALANELTPQLHEFPEPPTSIVSAWQAVQRSRYLTQRALQRRLRR
jgi:hypothetical protein